SLRLSLPTRRSSDLSLAASVSLACDFGGGRDNISPRATPTATIGESAELRRCWRLARAADRPRKSGTSQPGGRQPARAIVEGDDPGISRRPGEPYAPQRPQQDPAQEARAQSPRASSIANLSAR